MAAEETNVTKVRFNYLRSNYFRVIHCDLARCDLTPGNNFAVTIFSESSDHPRAIVHEVSVSTDGGFSLGPEINREGDPDDELVIAREVEAKIILTPESARRMSKTFQLMLQQLEGEETES